jgi:hypothetical protein
LIARAARCISIAQFSASTTLEKSASKLSPAVPALGPPMRGDQRVDSTAQLTERSMRARLILAHQTAETDHIRVQNGGQACASECRHRGYPVIDRCTVSLGVEEDVDNECVCPPAKAPRRTKITW